MRTELFIAKAKSTLTGLPGSINSENASRKKNQKMQLSSEKKKSSKKQLQLTALVITKAAS
jgi:hypothetical protein